MDQAADLTVIRRWHRNSLAPESIVDGLAKGLASLEGGRVRGDDGDALAGAGIAAWARSRREGSEADNPDCLTAGESIGNGREHGTHGGGGVRLGNGCSGSDASGEVGLVHSGSPLESVRLSVSRYRTWSCRASLTDPD